LVLYEALIKFTIAVYPTLVTGITSRQDYTYIKLAKGGNHCAEFEVYHVRSSDTYV